MAKQFKYYVDLEAERIKIPSGRWYDVGEGKRYPSVTTVLSAKAKDGLSNWQIELASQGIDPNKYADVLAGHGSEMHNGIELLLMNEELSFYDAEMNERYDFYKEWKPLCRFKQAKEDWQIEPILIEQKIWSNRMRVAGTLDLLAFVTPPKGKRHLAQIDHKSSKATYVDHKWQQAAYKECFVEMVTKRKDKGGKELAKFLAKKITKADIDGMKCYTLLLGVETAKGWRMTETKNPEYCLEGFEACNNMFRNLNPNFNTIEKEYPLTLKLD